MVADVSNLVSMLATQPVAQMENLTQKLESAQAFKAQQEQQAIENYRKSVKDNLEMQVNLGKINKNQLESTRKQMEITAGVAGSILQSKDPLVRQQVFDQAIPLLKAAGHTDDKIEAARALLPNDDVWKGYIAQGTATNEVYKTYFGEEKPAYKPGQIVDFPATVNGKPGKISGQFVSKDYQEPGMPAGLKKVSEVQTKEGTEVNIYGERESLEYTKRAAAAMDEATKQANIARQSNSAMQYAQQLLQGMNTGSLSEVNVALGKMASSMGVEYKGVANMEAARGALADMVKAQLSAFPGAISEGERAYAISVSPQLASTPEGRTRLVNFLTEVNNRSIEYQRRMDKYIAENPKMNLYKEGKPSFIGEWNDYVEKNPLSILSEEAGKKPTITSEQWGSATKAATNPKTKEEIRFINGKWMNQRGEEVKSGK